MVRSPPPTTEYAVGAISITWSILENTLMSILGAFVECDDHTAIVLSAALDYRHRRDLINSFAPIKLADSPELLAEVEAFMGSVGGMSKERNLAVHGIWAWAKDGHPTLLSLRNQGAFTVDFKPVSPRHLIAIAKKIEALSKEGMHLAVQVQEHVAAWRQKRPEQQRYPQDRLAHRLAAHLDKHKPQRRS